MLRTKFIVFDNKLGEILNQGTRIESSTWFIGWVFKFFEPKMPKSHILWHYLVNLSTFNLYIQSIDPKKNIT
jgi:hypothetical protein